jgi:hypothetical protein
MGSDDRPRIKPPRMRFVIVLLLCVAAFGWFVWPSHYVYGKKDLGMFGVQEIRTDRFTGKHEINADGFWQPIGVSPSGEVTIPPGTLLITGPQDHGAKGD